MKNLSKEIENAKLTLNSLKLNADGTEKNRLNASTLRKIKLVENKIASMQKELDAQPKMLNAPATSDANNNSTASVNNDLLNKLSAMNITDKIKKSSETRSVFKKEFNNKSDRTKCRTKFLNAISLYLLNKAHNKIDLANAELSKAKDIAKQYYVAEDKFLVYSDYCTENLDADKKNAIKLFIEEIKA